MIVNELAYMVVLHNYLFVLFILFILAAMRGDRRREERKQKIIIK